MREAKAASALSHPNILVIHEIGKSEDGHYIVSEFIEGRTLREVLSQTQMSWEESPWCYNSDRQCSFNRTRSASHSP